MAPQANEAGERGTRKDAGQVVTFLLWFARRLRSQLSQKLFFLFFVPHRCSACCRDEPRTSRRRQTQLAGAARPAPARRQRERRLQAPTQTPGKSRTRGYFPHASWCGECCVLVVCRLISRSSHLTDISVHSTRTRVTPFSPGWYPMDGKSVSQTMVNLSMI